MTPREKIQSPQSPTSSRGQPHPIILILGATCVLIGLSANAEWKFDQPKSRKAEAPHILSEEETHTLTARPSTPPRIQVMGGAKVPGSTLTKPVLEARRKEDTARDDGSAGEVPPDSMSAVSLDSPRDEKNDSASSYAEMLKADEARLRRMEQESSSIDRDFEAARTRMRNRKVAESAAAPSAPANPPTPARRASVKPAPVSPALETEVITPQKPVGRAASTPVSGSDTPARASGEVNPAFPYTHLLPSPFNLPQGTWVIGSTVAYGLIDFLQISTNVVRTIEQHWNFRAKVPLVEFPTFVASAYVDYESYNPHAIANDNPDIRLNRWQPGLVTGYELASDMAFFLGGNFNFGKDPIPVKTTSGYLHGAQLEADWSWLYNPSRSRLGDNAISAGVTYDLTYDMFGFGFTHHWRTFELGVHYTFADRDRFLPIAGFSFAASF